MNKHRMETVVFCRDILYTQVPDVSPSLSKVLERKLIDLRSAEQRALAQMDAHVSKPCTERNRQKSIKCLELLNKALDASLSNDQYVMYTALDELVVGWLT